MNFEKGSTYFQELQSSSSVNRNIHFGGQQDEAAVELLVAPESRCSLTPILTGDRPLQSPVRQRGAGSLSRERVTAPAGWVP